MRSSVTCSGAAPARDVLWGPYGWLAVFFGMALLLPPLPVALGSTGPHLSLLAAAAGVWAGLRRLPNWRWELDTLSLPVLALLGALLGSVAMAAAYSGVTVAIASLARVCLFGIAVYTFFYVRGEPREASLKQTSTLIQVMFWAAVASAGFACLDFYFQFPAPAGFARQFVFVPGRVSRRAQGVFYDAGALGNLCAFFLEMIAVIVITRARSLPALSPALAAAGVVLASALILSFSRGSLANLLAALAALLWLERRRLSFPRWIAGAVVAAGATAALLYVTVPVFAHVYWYRIVASIQNFGQLPDKVLSGRLHSWTLLANFLLAHPARAILGTGYKTLPYTGVAGAPVIADNAYLSALVEAGVFGLAAVLALNVAILSAAYRVSKSGSERAALGAWMFCFWTGQSVQMLTVDLLTYWRVLPVYFCVLAFATRKEPGEHPVP